MLQPWRWYNHDVVVQLLQPLRCNWIIIETAGEGGIAKKIREAVSECKAGPSVICQAKITAYDVL